MLVPVLAWASVILGLFIGVNFLLPSSVPSQYNIGCYLAPINFTSTLKARLAIASDLASPILYQHRSIVPEDDLFDKQLMTVAASFERYVQQLGDEQRVRVKDRLILSAINEAESSFNKCREDIRDTIDSAACNRTWSSYLYCFEEVSMARSKIEGLLKREKDIQKQITSQIQQPKEDPEQRPQFLAELAYNESIRANQASIADMRNRLSEADHKLQKILDLKFTAVDRLSSKERTYKQCYQNRRIFKHCQQITQRVKNISTNILQQLKQQLQSKTRLMQEMREMMLRMGRGENRKMPEHWNEMYQKHKEEYKRMYLDYIYNTHKESKACGCSEQEEKILQEEVRKEEQIIEDYQNDIFELNRIMEGLKNDVGKNQLEREKIIQRYQQALREYDTTKPDIKETNLIRLKRALQTNREDILDMKDRYNQIDQGCRIIKAKLAATVKDIDKVEACLSKKEYLKKLRSETAKYLQPQRSLAKLETFKKELAQALAGIELNE